MANQPPSPPNLIPINSTCSNIFSKLLITHHFRLFDTWFSELFRSERKEY